mgnify:CR=1 FL=1
MFSSLIVAPARVKLALAGVLLGGAVLAGAYFMGWSARGDKEAANDAQRRIETGETVKRIENDVRKIEDDGLADRLSHGR